MPALPLDEAGKYVAAAYLVFLALILTYVAIMAAKLQRIDRELGDLADLAEGRAAQARDEIRGRAIEPAATPAPEPAGAGREAEDVGGGVREASGGGVPEDVGGGVPS
jgi:uncharacterized membrane protein